VHIEPNSQIFCCQNLPMMDRIWMAVSFRKSCPDLHCACTKIVRSSGSSFLNANPRVSSLLGITSIMLDENGGGGAGAGAGAWARGANHELETPTHHGCDDTFSR
jgi:hypothetical protein